MEIWYYKPKIAEGVSAVGEFEMTNNNQKQKKTNMS